VLFTTSCFANILGLNISSAFNSAVTVYILIPLLLIPQMILSGLLFNFDKLNELFSKKGEVPLVADIMVSRWAYEAMAVHQFKDNAYEEMFYAYDKQQSQADFKSAYLADELKLRNTFLNENLNSKSDSVQQIVANDASIVKYALEYEPKYTGPTGERLDQFLSAAAHTPEIGKTLNVYFERYKRDYQNIYNEQDALLEKKMAFLEKNGWHVTSNKNKYYNESLADLVRNINTKNRMLEYNGKLIQQIDPIYQDPKPANFLDYRAPFFVPEKNLLGVRVDTYVFNMLVIWCMTLFLYLTLYTEALRRAIGFLDEVMKKKPKSPKIVPLKDAV
jgi:ABC transport system ATP-binding/permease protein